MKIDTRTATWQTIKKHCEDRVATLAITLEGNMSWDETVKLRAQLKELRGILALADTPEAPLVETDFELPN